MLATGPQDNFSKNATQEDLSPTPIPASAPTRVRKNIKFFMNLFVLGIILVVLLQHAPLTEYWLTLSNANFFWVLLTLVLRIIPVVLAGLNYSILLTPLLNSSSSHSQLGKSIPVVTILRHYYSTWAVASVAPAKLGELWMVVLLKRKQGIDYGLGLAVFFVNKFISLLVVLVLSLGGFYLYFGLGNFLTATFTCLLSASVALMLLARQDIRSLIKKYVLKGYAEHFDGFSHYTFRLLQSARSAVALNFLLTLMQWLINFYTAYLLFFAFNYTVEYYQVVFVFSAVAILTMLPITIAGFGVREGIGTLLFHTLGVPVVIGLNVFITRNIQKYVLALFCYWQARR